MHGVGRSPSLIDPDFVGGRAHGAIRGPYRDWLVRNASVIESKYIIWNRVSWKGSNRGAPKDRWYTVPDPHDRSHPRGAEQGRCRAQNCVVPPLPGWRRPAFNRSANQIHIRSRTVGLLCTLPAVRRDSTV